MESSDSVTMALIHLPLATLIFLGICFVQKDWRETEQRIAFLKFCGDTETIVLKKTTPFKTPTEFSFYPAHPNPFNPVTTIRFSTKTDSHLSLRIYDTTGKLVETLVEEKISAGNHTVRWNAEKFSSGMYFVQFQNSGNVQTQKIILLK